MIKLISDKCLECGRKSQHEHHIIPASRGGKSIISLCNRCHGLVHGLKMEINELVKEGIRKARERGVIIGRPIKLDRNKIISLKRQGIKPKQIAKQLEYNYSSTRKVLAQDAKNR